MTNTTSLSSPVTGGYCTQFNTNGTPSDFDKTMTNQPTATSATRLARKRVSDPSVAKQDEVLVDHPLRRVTDVELSPDNYKDFDSDEIKVRSRNPRPRMQAQAGIEVDVEQITTFKDEGEKVTSEAYKMGSSSIQTGMGEELRQHTIKDIVARPLTLSTTDWLEATNRGSVISELQVPSDIITGQDNIVNKLAHFAFFRATTTFKVFVNATPFTQGKLWIWYVPNNGARAGYIPGGMGLTRQTGYYGAELDVGSGGTAELTLPCVTPYGYYDLVNGFADWGTIYITVMNPLAREPIDFNPVIIRKMAWFSDIELTYPAGDHGVFLSGKKKGAVSRARPLMQAQTKDEALEKSSSGLVSAPLGHVANALTSLGKIGPLVSGYVQPAAWAARVLAKTAEAAGYCKPQTLQSTTVIQNIPMRGFTHADGLDYSVRLGAYQDGGTTTPQGMGGSMADEMGIRHLAQRAAIITTVPWNTSMAQFGLLAFWQVTPALVDSLSASQESTPLAFVSTRFTYYRGSIVYRFSAAKTAYHSGRLRISFFPRQYGEPGLDPDNYDPENVYNVVWDLRESSECEFVVPHASSYPWLKVAPRPINTAMDFNGDMISPGTITLEIFNPLLASANVPSDININIWTSAGKDFDCAVPYSVCPLVPDFIPLDKPKVVMEAQVLEMDQSSMMDNPNSRSSAPAPKFGGLMDGVEVNGMTHGEKYESARQLIKRFTLFADSTQTPDAFGGMFMDAFRFNRDDTATSTYVDALSEWSHAFAFFAGSLRYKVVFNIPPEHAANIHNHHVQVDIFWTASYPYSQLETFVTSPPATGAVPEAHLYSHQQDVTLNPVVEFEVPFFKQFPLGSLRKPGPPQTTPYREGFIMIVIKPADRFSIIHQIPGNYRIYRAAGDDFNFMWPVGTPLINADPAVSSTTLGPLYSETAFPST